jgi:hypothetical protein
MKKIELKNRIQVNENLYDFCMVDLFIDGKKINTGNSPNGSYYFWQDLEEASQKAMKRLEDNNDEKMKRTFHVGGLHTLMTTPEQRETQFKNFLVKRYDNLDIDKLTGIINKAIESIELNGPKDGEHPNPFLKFKLTDNLVKTIIANVVSEYIKE